MPPKNEKISGLAVNDDQLIALVVKARDGNRAAFNQLIDRFQDAVFRMVYYRTRSHVDAEDLTQDIFVKAYQHISRIRETDRFRSWLFSIALNRVRDFHRKKRFRGLFKASDDNIDPEFPDMQTRDKPEALDNVLKAEFWQQIGLILNKLSGMEREVFILRFMDHLNIREISQALKKSESTVKTHLYRALAKFKKESSLRRFLQEVSQ